MILSFDSSNITSNPLTKSIKTGNKIYIQHLSTKFISIYWKSNTIASESQMLIISHLAEYKKDKTNNIKRWKSLLSYATKFAPELEVPCQERVTKNSEQ